LKSVFCTYSQECAEGLFCSEGKCAPQLAVGSSCNYTEDCVNTAGCDYGVCVEYFSLPVGNATNYVIAPNFYPSCQTGYANVSETGFVCDNAPVSLNPGASCTVPSKCMAKDGVNFKYCQCGLNGQGHCPLFEGDQEVVSLIQAMKTLITVTGTNQCHTNGRFNYECYIAFNNPTIMSAYLNYSQYAQLYFNDVYTKLPGSTSCQQKANVPDYVNILSQIQGTNPECPVYYTQDFEQGTGELCVWNNENIFNSLLATSTMLFYCNSSSVCSVSPGENGFCVDNSVDNNYPGQNCSLNFNCHSNICSNGMCQGETENQGCETSKDCDPGLYCYGSTGVKTCQPVATLGQSCVSTPCQSTLLCDLNVCVQYYSKSLGSVTQDVVGFFARACQSGFAIKDTAGDYLCELAPISSTPGAKCTPGSFCIDSSGKYGKPCVCGFDGNGYCQAFEGDSYLQNAIKSFNKIQNVQCNQALGISSGCYERSLLNLLEYYYYESNYTMYEALPYFQGSAEKRIVNTYYPQYSNALIQIRLILQELFPNDESSSSSSSSSSFAEMIGIPGVLALVYLV